LVLGKLLQAIARVDESFENYPMTAGWWFGT